MPDLPRRSLVSLVIVLLLFAAPLGAQEAQEARKTRNVILVTLDGLRHEEVFGGLDRKLVHPVHGGVRDTAALQQAFADAKREQRREKLMPFFWKTIAKQGVVFGDESRRSIARCTNGLYFSYPGYNELLTGARDPRIDSNKKEHNRNVTVLEWLHQKPAYRGKVAAFTCWDVFPYIINTPRSGIPVQSGFDPPIASPLTDADRAVNDMAANLPRYWPGVQYDVVPFLGAMTAMKRDKPRVLYLGLGETDDWAHDRRYDLYLNAAHYSDDFIRRLWEQAQSMDEYRGKTSLVITTDHGRGGTLKDWTSHGKDIRGADRIWIAVLGPDTPATGVVPNVQVTQDQVAATVAWLLGEPFHRDVKRVAEPLPGIIGKND